MGRAERRHKAKPQNNFKHQEKRWLAHIREMVPKIYAAFCLVLWNDYHLTFEQIVDILKKTQDMWQRDGENGFDIVKVCAEKTGINLMSKVTADAIGVEEGEHETYDGVEM